MLKELVAMQPVLLCIIERSRLFERSHGFNMSMMKGSARCDLRLHRGSSDGQLRPWPVLVNAKPD